MKSTSVISNDTRIIPASRDRKAKEITKNPDGSLSITFGNGEKGVLPASEINMQAFAVWTMLNSECTDT